MKHFPLTSLCFFLIAATSILLPPSAYADGWTVTTYVRDSLSITITPSSETHNPQADVGGIDSNSSGHPEVYALIALANVGGTVTGNWHRSATYSGSGTPAWVVNISGSAQGILQTGSISGASCYSNFVVAAMGKTITDHGNLPTDPLTVPPTLDYSKPKSDSTSGSGSFVTGAMSLTASAANIYPYGYATGSIDFILSVPANPGGPGIAYHTQRSQSKHLAPKSFVRTSRKIATVARHQTSS